MSNNSFNRRDFLITTGQVALSCSLLPSILTTESQAASASGFPVKKQARTLVFIMLDGGNDSFNMLTPISGRAYDEYRLSRSNLALAQNNLLLLKGVSPRHLDLGLHQSLKDVRNLFDAKKLSFVANIGPLIEPVTKKAFQQNAVKLPIGLMSHSDQFKHWQTARPGERLNQGWFGAMADAIQGETGPNEIPMNISLAGSNIMQNGAMASEYSIKADGSRGIEIYKGQDDLSQLLRGSLANVLNHRYSSPFKETYLRTTRKAQSQHEIFQRALDQVSVSSHFSDTDLSQQLAMVVKSIKAAPLLGIKQQTYFLRYIGWDHHDELLKNHAKMLKVLNDALFEFQTALEREGLAEQVVTFTGSDFGRTLTSNGNGTDHGWGGNTIVMGNDIKGGQVFGEYPSLALNSHLDVGNGVLIPTTSIDQLYSELAEWYGVDKSMISRLYPNLKNFPGKKLGII